jgi:FkbM family methyltransferase
LGPIKTKEAFDSGKIGKADYIQAMHQYHRILFEYSELIRTTDIARIEIIDGQVIATSRKNGIVMACDPFDQRIAPIEILNFDEYEKPECDMALRLIDDGQNVFDIGGNFGWYSLLIAKSRDVKVFSFEPIPKTYAFLANNISLNHAENIDLFNFGFSDKEQEVDFFYYPEGSGNASLAQLSDRDNVCSIRCTVRRLDDFTKERGTRVDFIKCDVEGAELLVYRGGVETLRRDKPVVFSELLRKWSARFGYHPNEVLDLFFREGYGCFTVADDGLKEIHAIDDDTVETNFFFLHKEKHADKISSVASERGGAR